MSLFAQHQYPAWHWQKLYLLGCSCCFKWRRSTFIYFWWVGITLYPYSWDCGILKGQWWLHTTLLHSLHPGPTSFITSWSVKGSNNGLQSLHSLKKTDYPDFKLGSKAVVVVQIFNATRHPRHIHVHVEAVVIVMYMYLYSLAFMDHPCTLGAAVCHQAPSCPLYTQPRACRVWARRTNGLKIVSTRTGFEPTKYITHESRVR